MMGAQYVNLMLGVIQCIFFFFFFEKQLNSFLYKRFYHKPSSTFGCGKKKKLLDFKNRTKLKKYLVACKCVKH